MTQPVIDLGSNLEENLQRWSRALQAGGCKLAVFTTIYSGKRSRWTAKEISSYLKGKISPKRVTECGKKLVGDGLARQVEGIYPIVYEKIPDVHHHKAAILRLVCNRSKRESLPTKRSTRVDVRIGRSREKRWRVREITVDDIDQFKRVNKVVSGGPALKPLPEARFKKGLQRLFDDFGSYPDWGGEKNDFFTDRLRLGGKRCSAAFALKGPGAGVKTIYPGKWGKRGNQIQHLADSPARVFILQSELQIDEDSIDQLRKLVEHKAQAQRDRLFYGSIGPDDSRRLRRTYPAYFK